MFGCFSCSIPEGVSSLEVKDEIGSGCRSDGESFAVGAGACRTCFARSARGGFRRDAPWHQGGIEDVFLTRIRRGVLTLQVIHLDRQCFGGD